MKKIISNNIFKASTALLIMLFSVSAKAQFGVVYYPGSYYNTAGKKISGLISFHPYTDRMFFKTDNDAKYEKISIDDIKAVIVKVPVADSIVVVTEDNKDDKK